MPTLRNDTLIRALLRQPVDRTPVWFMRQAGRYLPEYRATRAKAGDFLTLCKTPELACEVTLQPIRRFPLDAAILFSDILTIPDAMGLGLTVAEGIGPQFDRPLSTAKDIAALGVPDPEGELAYVMDAVRVVKRELDGKVPLIGFSGSPWTLACYMVEGGGSKDFAKIKTLMFDEPQAMHQLLETLAKAVTDYLNAQIAAGVNVVMVFDTWGGVLTPRDYQQFSLNYMSGIAAGLTKEHQGQRIPSILFTKGGGQWLEQMAVIGYDALGLDWTVNIKEARQRVGGQVALQGNMDPNMLHASPERIKEEVKIILDGFGKGTGHVFNLGHGVQPSTDPEHVAAMIDAVHSLSKR